MTATTADDKPIFNVAKYFRSVGAIGALAGATWFGIDTYQNSSNPTPSVIAEHQQTARELVQSANHLTQNESQPWTLQLGPKALELASDCISANYQSNATVVVVGDKLATYNGLFSKNVAACFEQKAANLVRPLPPLSVALDTVSQTLVGGVIGGIGAFVVLTIIQGRINSYSARRKERRTSQKSTPLEP